MKRKEPLDKDEMELAKSLENEEWVSDLSNKEKKRYEKYAQASLTTLQCSINNAPMMSYIQYYPIVE